MSHTISVEEAAIQLTRLVRGLGPDDEIVLTENNTPVARILPSPVRRPRVAGSCQGMLEILDDGNEVILGNV